MRGLVIALVLLFSSTCFAQDRYYSRSVPYERYSSSSYSSYSPIAPRLYAGDGRYLGELSSDRYAPNSISNPYGRYGSRYSPHSINNPYGPYGRYSTYPLYVYPRY